MLTLFLKVSYWGGGQDLGWLIYIAASPDPNPRGGGQPPNPPTPQPQERNPTPTSARRGETPTPNPKSTIPPQRARNQPTQTHAQEPWPIHTSPHPAHHDNPTRPTPPAKPPGRYIRPETTAGCGETQIPQPKMIPKQSQIHKIHQRQLSITRRIGHGKCTDT